MNCIRRWLQKRAKKAARRLSDAGYDYAAGRLLRAPRGNLESVKYELSMFADNRFDRNAFDSGIAHALTDFDNLFRLD